MAENTEKPKNEAGGLNDFFMRMGVLGELFAFLWKRKLYWLLPMIVTFMFFAVIIILGSSGVGSVFLYPLF